MTLYKLFSRHKIDKPTMKYGKRGGYTTNSKRRDTKKRRRETKKRRRETMKRR